MNGWGAFFRNSAVGRNHERHEKHESQKAIVAPWLPIFRVFCVFRGSPRVSGRRGGGSSLPRAWGRKRGLLFGADIQRVLSLEAGLLRKGWNGNPRGIAQLENPVAKTLGRQVFQNPFQFQKDGGPVGLFEGNDDDTVVFGKQPGDRVKEIAVRCQQDGLLLLANSKTARSSVPCSANSSTLHAEWSASFRKSAADFGKFSSRRKFMPPHDRRVPDSPSFGWRTQEPRQDRLS